MKKLILLSILLIVGCEEPSQQGCLDSQACNYDADATIDNNSCAYANDCAGVCGGGAVEDCAGVCGGDATLTECIIGTYIISTLIKYQSSDCSGIGEDKMERITISIMMFPIMLVHKLAM